GGGGFANSRRRNRATFGRTSAFRLGEVLVEARLVEEDDAEAAGGGTVAGGGEVFEAERVHVGFLERYGKLLVAALTMILVAVVAALVTQLGKPSKKDPQLGSDAKANLSVAGRKKCDPCRREAYTIKAFLHETHEGQLAESILPAARRAARDLNVTLDEKLYFTNGFSEEEMASDIRAAVGTADALVVTIPSKAVANAVRYVGQDVPVFGLTSGFDVASGEDSLIEDGSLIFLSSSDDRAGGERAASYFLDGAHDQSLRALFLSPPGERNKTLYRQRFEGYRDRLWAASNSSIEVEWLEADSMRQHEKFSGCPYQFVLVGAGKFAPAMAHAVREMSDCPQTQIGTFDISRQIEDSLSSGLLDFAVVEPESLQGLTAVQFAALYAATGAVVAPPPSGVYLAGPVLFTKENHTRNGASTVCPDDSEACLHAIFGTEASAASECECNLRKNIVIAAVVHGHKTSMFWDRVVDAAQQGAADTGIHLLSQRLELPDGETLYELMSDLILEYCRGGVHGLVVTLSDDIVAEAVRTCKLMNPNIVIASIEEEYEKSRELNLLHHFGMDDMVAGYRAGKKMAEMATFDKALCLIYIPAHLRRCDGFEKAMQEEEGVEYVGHIYVPENNVTEYVRIVGKAANESRNYGILMDVETALPGALKLKNQMEGRVGRGGNGTKSKHIFLATFGVDDLVHQSLTTGDVLFGIDEQSYLLGYLPISILTHAISTGQSFLNHLIKTGPSFIITPPTKECEAKNVTDCQSEEVKEPGNLLHPSPSTLTAQPSTSRPPSYEPTWHPSISFEPSSAPSFDQRPTLQIVQERGHVRCGLLNATIESKEGLLFDLCRSVAAVLLGNPDDFVGVRATSSTRFDLLHGRTVDLLLLGDTHTIEREVRERTTGAGFTCPYYYDGMAYMGDEAFVRCAEDEIRYGDCASLSICVLDGSTSQDYVQSSFPSDFFVVVPPGSSFEQMLEDGTCNVCAWDRSALLRFASRLDKDYIVGNKTRTNEPLAIVTRNSDRKFSDAVNWVIQSLFYGEEKGLAKDPTLCEDYTSFPTLPSDLNFLNAVHCEGSYGQILDGDEGNRGMNQINDGSSGMMYPIPFGELESNMYGDGHSTGNLLDRIKADGQLKCGVTVPEGFSMTRISTDSIVGMSVDYCRALAAAIFHGDISAVEILNFTEESDSLAALNDESIDVLAGPNIDLKYDLGRLPTLGGFYFSTPCHISGNESAK
ncbi:hypothetical protein ACHAWF_009200, partial [Thalassiosira exigua]